MGFIELDNPAAVGLTLSRRPRLCRNIPKVGYTASHSHSLMVTKFINVLLWFRTVVCFL
jgi:hypothetical protein